ncbi:MAG: riboflavin kinase [Patescibacteria group bacterium]|jgi:riboflavin kinase/FMN adenylyltransferase
MPPVTLKGIVQLGKKRGKKLGFPTINISVPPALTKKHWGIYFSLVKIGQNFYPGITHLGLPKTFGAKLATCETHLLTLRKNLYGTSVTKILLQKTRDIKKFSSQAALIKQLRSDVKAAKKFFDL